MDTPESAKNTVTPVDHERQIQHVGQFQRAYRSTLLQVIIVGMVSFMNPGIWNALNSEKRRALASLDAKN